MWTGTAAGTKPVSICAGIGAVGRKPTYCFSDHRCLVRRGPYGSGVRYFRLRVLARTVPTSGELSPQLGPSGTGMARVVSFRSSVLPERVRGSPA
jgi:hypothetical protein